MPKFQKGDEVFCTKHWFHGVVRATYTLREGDPVTYCVVVTKGGNLYCPPEDYLELAKPLVLLVSSKA